MRQRVRESRTLSRWAFPAVGAIGVWIIGVAVFAASGRTGIFGVGYSDLSSALSSGIGWKLAGLLAVGKLLAAVFSYGTGGCGGIFSPTLFIGGMAGFLTSGLLGLWLPLTPSDRLILAATGMSCCFGVVVRAPVTAVLMVFEMTHQFAMIPALLLGTLISQSIARLALHESFDDGVLRQDGREPHRITAPRNMAVWRSVPVSALGSGSPVFLTDLAPAALREHLKRFHYRCFPVMLSGRIVGVTTRTAMESALAQNVEPTMETPVIVEAGQTIGDVEPLLIQSDAGVFLVRDTPDGPVNRLFTLHDLIRAQADVFE
ncbi:MAG TPA: hypothetical protein DCS43_11835 [Verrucomicrobia bacterium]|nr:hypothetical protein [Verrucomicrobiota bacterium]